jgi:hypothetical protein
LREFIKENNIKKTSKNSPAFCLFKYYRLLIFNFKKVLKSLIKSIGKDPDEYSSRSFRRGGASWAFSAEVPSE